ncbi:hypothetical protein [Corynebacterium sp. Marseille-Q2516]
MESFNDWPADFSGPFHRSGPGGSGPHARRGMRRGGPGHNPNHNHNHNHGHGPGPDNSPAQGGWGWDPRFGSAPTPGFGPEAPTVPMPTPRAADMAIRTRIRILAVVAAGVAGAPGAGVFARGLSRCWRRGRCTATR